MISSYIYQYFLIGIIWIIFIELIELYRKSTIHRTLFARIVIIGTWPYTILILIIKFLIKQYNGKNNNRT